MCLALFTSSHCSATEILRVLYMQRNQDEGKKLRMFATPNCNKPVILKSSYVQVSSPVGGEAKPIYLMV